MQVAGTVITSLLTLATNIAFTVGVSSYIIRNNTFSISVVEKPSENLTSDNDYRSYC